MFQSNPYEEIVVKATDEKQTVENWEINVTIYDQVNAQGEIGSRNCIAAIQKRLQHRSANVQLLSLTLADALVNNCKEPLHKEINSKVFTQTLIRLVNDRNIHVEVKKRILKLIHEWTRDHPNDPNFDLMVETRDSLRAQNHRFEEERPKSPAGPSDEDRRREELEIQAAIAASEASLAASRQSQLELSSRSNSTGKRTSDQPSSTSKSLPQSPIPQSSPSLFSRSDKGKQVEVSSSPSPSSPQKRVRALYDFDPTENDSLGFKQGDVIHVMEEVYAEWWKGELNGRVGIFPANYVEVINDPTPASLAAEASAEAEVFAQSSSIDTLLIKMRALKDRGQDITDNEEIQELYERSMGLRPMVGKLIEKYDKKQEELRAINDKFARAQQLMMVTPSRSEPAPSNYTTAPPIQQQQQQPHLDPRIEQQRLEYEAQWDAYHAAKREYDLQRQAAVFYPRQVGQATLGQSAPVVPDGVAPVRSQVYSPPQQQQQYQQQFQPDRRPVSQNATRESSQPQHSYLQPHPSQIPQPAVHHHQPPPSRTEYFDPRAEQHRLQMIELQQQQQARRSIEGDDTTARYHAGQDAAATPVTTSEDDRFYRTSPLPAQLQQPRHSLSATGTHSFVQEHNIPFPVAAETYWNGVAWVITQSPPPASLQQLVTSPEPYPSSTVYAPSQQQQQQQQQLPSPTYLNAQMDGRDFNSAPPLQHYQQPQHSSQSSSSRGLPFASAISPPPVTIDEYGQPFDGDARIRHSSIAPHPDPLRRISSGTGRTESTHGV